MPRKFKHRQPYVSMEVTMSKKSVNFTSRDHYEQNSMVSITMSPASAQLLAHEIFAEYGSLDGMWVRVLKQ